MERAVQKCAAFFLVDVPRWGLKRQAIGFGAIKGGGSRVRRSSFNTPHLLRPHHVAPAEAGAYRAFRARLTDVIGPSLRRGDGSWKRTPHPNALRRDPRQHYFPRESRVINMAARFA